MPTSTRACQPRLVDRPELLAVGIFGGGSQIRRRLEMLLRGGRTFSPRASTRRVAAGSAMLAALLMAAALLPRWIAFAQASPLPSFEVASVKPAGPQAEGARTGVFFTVGGGFEALGAQLRTILALAFDVRDYQISGMPGWADSAKFDILARPPGGVASLDQRRLMVQSLLAERFHLIVHRETREGQVYELTLAKGGVKLREATDSLQGKQQGLGSRGRGLLYGMACPLPILANQLSQELGRPVLDKTGLTGHYDFTLKWAPDPGALPQGTDGDSLPPSLFTALQEDLGLRLQAAKGPVETLVIDHMAKPDAN